MFKKKQDKIAQLLDEAIIQVHTEMKVMTSDDAEYAKMSTQLEKLHNLRNACSDEKVSVNTLLIVAGNLVGILTIIGYERTHMMTTKALGMIKPAR